MPQYKTIQQIITPPKPHWVGNGFLVNSYFNNFIQDNSPFLLLDYASKKYFEPSNLERGVGSHPHRGFETVTIALSGSIEHHDSYGGAGIIGAGDVQWMTAGSGVLHKEYLEKEFSRKGGDLEMIQIWINLAKKNKMTTPKYQSILANSIPKILEEKAEISIIAGNYKNQYGVASTFSPIELYIIKLLSDANLELAFPKNYNTMILVLEGEVNINNQNLETKELIIFNNDATDIKIITNQKGARLLILSAEPINEPIAHYGPFVMNESSELIKAIEDFNSGKFGKLD